MEIRTEFIEIETRGHSDIVDVTPRVHDLLARTGLQEGQVTVFASGSTAEILSSDTFDSDSRIEIYGRSGTMVCRDTLSDSGGGRVCYGGKTFDYDPQALYVEEMRDFTEAVERGGLRRNRLGGDVHPASGAAERAARAENACRYPRKRS